MALEVLAIFYHDVVEGQRSIWVEKELVERSLCFECKQMAKIGA